MMSWLESFNLGIKYSDTLSVSFFRMPTKQLLSNTYSQDGLAKGANDLV